MGHESRDIHVSSTMLCGMPCVDHDHPGCEDGEPCARTPEIVARSPWHQRPSRSRRSLGLEARRVENEWEYLVGRHRRDHLQKPSVPTLVFPNIVLRARRLPTLPSTPCVKQAIIIEKLGMMGRTRHPVHSVHEDMGITSPLPSPEERKDDKSSFFSRKIANFLRRSSVTTPGQSRLRMNDGNLVVQTMGNGSSPTSDTARRALSRIVRNKQSMHVTDTEISFGTKHHAVATTNGVRQANEDRYRVITDLELFGKGLITADRKVHTYQEVLDTQVLEHFAREHNAPKMDVKKLLKHKTLTRTEFYGVFDGHGGATCSSILALLFPLYLLLSPDYHSNVSAAAKRACLSINDEILKREAADQCEGGSTALTVMIRNGVAYVCNIGDCRAIMISTGGVTALTTDHKATNENEKQRIEDAGGLVLYVKGIARVNGRLAVSRAFGDAELQQYVIANPEITCHQLAADDEYIVIGSDGLWDALTNEQVMAVIRNHPWLSIDEIAQVLIKRAIEEGSMDNVTVLLIDVRKR